MRAVRVLIPVVLWMSLSACGGFRGGYVSMPYVGEPPPPESSTWPDQLTPPHSVQLPDLRLEVRLNNSTQTYDFQVIFFVVPVYINLEESRREKGARLEVSMQIDPRTAEYSFGPHEMIVSIDGERYRPTAVWLENQERRRRVWDDFIRRPPAPDGAKPVIPSLEEWREPVDAPIAMTGTKYEFIASFECPVPTLDQEIVLDLSRALSLPAQPQAPVIRFKKTRWRGTYS